MLSKTSFLDWMHLVEGEQPLNHFNYHNSTRFAGGGALHWKHK